MGYIFVQARDVLGGLSHKKMTRGRWNAHSPRVAFWITARALRSGSAYSAAAVLAAIVGVREGGSAAARAHYFDRGGTGGRCSSGCGSAGSRNRCCAGNRSGGADGSFTASDAAHIFDSRFDLVAEVHGLVVVVETDAVRDGGVDVPAAGIAWTFQPPERPPDIPPAGAVMRCSPVLM